MAKYNKNNYETMYGCRWHVSPALQTTAPPAQTKVHSCRVSWTLQVVMIEPPPGQISAVLLLLYDSLG